VTRWFVAAAAVAACLLVGACSSSPEPGTVEMTDSQRFDPETITIEVGETITWVNESDEAHTVTAYGDEIPEGASYFASGGASNEEEARDDLSEGLIESGETFEVTLDTPGTYEYYCIPHESSGMKGTITVE
jgi:plastocyanin